MASPTYLSSLRGALTDDTDPIVRTSNRARTEKIERTPSSETQPGDLVLHEGRPTVRPGMGHPAESLSVHQDINQTPTSTIPFAEQLANKMNPLNMVTKPIEAVQGISQNLEPAARRYMGLKYRVLAAMGDPDAAAAVRAREAPGGAEYVPPSSESSETKSEPSGAERFEPVGAVPHEPEESGETPRFTPHYVGASEFATVNPRRQAAYAAALGHEAQAAQNIGEIKSAGAAAYASGLENAAKANMKDLGTLQGNVKARQQYLDNLSDDIQKDSENAAAQKIDPEHFWQTRSTPQKIMAVIASALGGFVQGVHGGRNGPADIIQQAIQDDISAQRANVENKWAGVHAKHSLLADRAQRYGSLDIAEKQQVAAKLDSVLMMAKAAEAKATTPIEKAYAQALTAQIEQKAVEAGIQFNKYAAAHWDNGGVGAPYGKPSDIKRGETVYIPGVGHVATGDDKNAQELNKQLLASSRVLTITSEMGNLIQGPLLSNPANKLLHPNEYNAAKKQLDELRGELSVMDMSQMIGNSARAKGLIDMLQEKQGPSDVILPWNRNAIVQATREMAAGARQNLEIRKRQLTGQPVVEFQPYRAKDGSVREGTYIVNHYNGTGGTAGEGLPVTDGSIPGMKPASGKALK